MNKVHKIVPIATEELSNSTEEDKKVQSHEVLKEHLPIIICDCGVEILVLPDVRAMDLAIEAHAAEHRNKTRNTSRQVNPSEDISLLLSQLTLIKISGLNNNEFLL